jgi:hypothetical protein
LIASAVVTIADGYAEREAAKAMIADAVQAKGDPDVEITLGADKSKAKKLPYQLYSPALNAQPPLPASGRHLLQGLTHAASQP